jgi:hypothetical protein
LDEEDLGKDEYQLYQEGKISVMEYLEIKRRNIDLTRVYPWPDGLSEDEWRTKIKSGEIKSAKEIFGDKIVNRHIINDCEGDPQEDD